MIRQIKVLQATTSTPTMIRSSFSVEANVIMVRLSLGEVIQYANTAFMRALNLPLEEILGKNIKRLVHFLDRSVYQQLQQSVLKEKVISTNIELQFSDGSIHWYQFVLESVEETDKTEIQVMGTEVTVFKRMEQVIELQRKLSLSSNLDETELTHLFFTSLVAMSPFICGALLLSGEEKEFSVIKKVGAKFTEKTLRFPVLDSPDEQNLLYPPRVSQYACSEHKIFSQICDSNGPIQSVAVIPLRIDDKRFAALLLGNPGKSPLSEEFENQLQSLVILVDSMLFQAREKQNILSKEKEIIGIFRSLSEMLILITTEGRIIEANPALIDRLNLENHADIADTIFDLHPAEWQFKIQQAITQVTKNGKIVFQVPLRIGDSDTILTECEMVVGLWHDQPVIICLYRDIRHQLQVEELERERRKMADALAESAVVLNSSLNREAVLAHILDMVVKIVPNAYTNIAVLEGARMHVVASRGYEKLGIRELLHSRVLNADKIQNLNQMIREKKECLIAETRDNPNWVTLPETMWVKSYIGAPIIVNGEVYGFINCDSEVPGNFTELDAENLKMFADQAAIAIENARLHQEVEQHLHKITRITELTRTVLVSSNVKDVTQKVALPLLTLFDANSIFISQWMSKERSAFCLSSHGAGIVPDFPKLTAYGNSTLSEYVLTQKHALILQNGQESVELNQLIGRLFTDPYILALPMWVEDNPFGVIFLGFNGRDQISEDDLAIGAFAANQLATAIQKTMMLESEQNLTQQYSHANELLTSLSRVAASLNSSSGPIGVMETMGEGLEKLHIHSMVFLLDEKLTHIHLEYSSRQSDLMAFTQKLEHNYFFDPFKIDNIVDYDRVVKLKKPVYLSDIGSLFYKLLPSELSPFMHRFFEILGIGPQSKGLLVPLLSENKPVGILNIYGDELIEIDQKAGETFGGQISAAFENAILLSKVQRLAVTDELTGIYNRRGLFENATNLFKSVRRLDRTLSILMLDLDDFKAINDQLGHDVGDEVLKEFVQQIKANIREIDLLARYGGEEFIVILEESDLKSSKIVAERICRHVATHSISTSQKKTKITVSIGVAELTPETESMEALIKQADRALYLAKNRGKNQVATLTG
ncbi:MAG: sensor domain-containing diguanylate cyclase [Anaerolineaceae bacterium]|nr:sensor domain-containing diguanylate cyclase [Anaerolineaceae bacterium]